MSNSMTRQEYINETSQNFTLNSKTLDFNLPDLKESKMDETIEMNSTIRSNKAEDIPKKMSESHQILPPIDDTSRLNFSIGQNTSFGKTLIVDKINMTDRSMNFLKQSMVSGSTDNRILRGSKSECTLKSLVPHNPPPLSKANPIPPKINTGRKVHHKRSSSFGRVTQGESFDPDEEVNKRFDDFNKALLTNHGMPDGSHKLHKTARKPAFSRTKNLSLLKNPNMVTYEDKISKKAYLERIMDYRVTSKAKRYTEL